MLSEAFFSLLRHVRGAVAGADADADVLVASLIDGLWLLPLLLLLLLASTLVVTMVALCGWCCARAVAIDGDDDDDDDDGGVMPCRGQDSALQKVRTAKRGMQSVRS